MNRSKRLRIVVGDDLAAAWPAGGITAAAATFAEASRIYGRVRAIPAWSD